MHVQEHDWIKFDVGKVLELQATYDEVMHFIQQDFPETNLNSTQQIKRLYLADHQIMLVDTKITTFQRIMEHYHQDHDLYIISEKIVAFLKAKFIMKNYIKQILSYEKDGIVTLRNTKGTLTLGRQPLSYNDEIHQCIVAQSPEAARQTPDFMSTTKGE
jgi:hypothetical protein